MTCSYAHATVFGACEGFHSTPAHDPNRLGIFNHVSTLPAFKLIRALSVQEARKWRRYNCIVPGPRVLLEQAFGTWRSQFPYIREDMRLSKDNCIKAIRGSVCLHNYCMLEGRMGFGRHSDSDSDDDEAGAGELGLPHANTMQQALKEEFQLPR